MQWFYRITFNRSNAFKGMAFVFPYSGLKGVVANGSNITVPRIAASSFESFILAAITAESVVPQ
jgi:hypothetical protein